MWTLAGVIVWPGVLGLARGRAYALMRGLRSPAHCGGRGRLSRRPPRARPVQVEAAEGLLLTRPVDSGSGSCRPCETAVESARRTNAREGAEPAGPCGSSEPALASPRTRFARPLTRRGGTEARTPRL